MRQPPSTVQKAFKLANDMEKQLQVVDSFKLKFPNFPPVEVNEISVEESSGDEFEVNEMSRGKRWGNNNNNNHKHSNFSNSQGFGNRPQYNKPQDSRQGKSWGQKGKDSKITLTQESAHFIPTEFSSSFFKQFDLAMKLKWEELRKQERNSTQVNEITKGDLIQAFGITEDQIQKAAEMLGKNEKTKKLGISSAWLPKGYGTESYRNSAEEKDKEVFYT